MNLGHAYSFCPYTFTTTSMLYFEGAKPGLSSNEREAPFHRAGEGR